MSALSVDWFGCILGQFLGHIGPNVHNKSTESQRYILRLLSLKQRSCHLSKIQIKLQQPKWNGQMIWEERRREWEGGRGQRKGGVFVVLVPNTVNDESPEGYNSSCPHKILGDKFVMCNEHICSLSVFKVQRTRSTSRLRSIPRFGEFCSCCCLQLPPQLAWSIITTWEWPFSQALYSKCDLN